MSDAIPTAEGAPLSASGDIKRREDAYGIEKRAPHAEGEARSGLQHDRLQLADRQCSGRLDSRLRVRMCDARPYFSMATLPSVRPGAPMPSGCASVVCRRNLSVRPAAAITRQWAAPKYLVRNSSITPCSCAPRTSIVSGRARGLWRGSANPYLSGSNSRPTTFTGRSGCVWA